MSFITYPPSSLSGASIYAQFGGGSDRWIGQVRHMGIAYTPEWYGEVANPVTWQVGDITGFYASSADQRGYYDLGPPSMTNAFQAAGDTFGSLINTSSFQHPAPVPGGGQNTVLAYNYGSPPPIYNHASSVFVVQSSFRVPRADISDLAPHGELSLEFQLRDTVSGGVIDYVAKVFDTRAYGTGTSNSFEETSYDPTAYNGSPLGIVYVPMLPGTTYGHVSPYSNTMVNTTPFADARFYRFEVSGPELEQAIATLNAWGGNFSTTPSNYRLLEVAMLHEVFVADDSHQVFMGTSSTGPYVIEFY